MKRMNTKNSAFNQAEATGACTKAWKLFGRPGPINRSTSKASTLTIHNVPVLPKPVQRPHPPIWVGCARSEDSFRWAGKEWLSSDDLYPIYIANPMYCRALSERTARASRMLAMISLRPKFSASSISTCRAVSKKR